MRSGLVLLSLLLLLLRLQPSILLTLSLSLCAFLPALLSVFSIALAANPMSPK